MHDDVALLERYVALFEAERFFDAHEVLEDAWRERGDEVLRGLIQLAATFVHIRAGHYAGAMRVLSRAQGHLRVGAPRWGIVDVEGLLAATIRLRGRLAQAERGDPIELPIDLPMGAFVGVARSEP